MKKTFLSFAVMLSAFTASAHDIEVDGIFYSFNAESGTVSVTFKGGDCDAYAGEYSGKVIIPSDIVYDKVNYRVTAVGTYAFYNCSELTSITIPSSITELNDYSFNGCSNLSEVIIEDCADALTTGYSKIFNNGAGFIVTSSLFNECSLKTLYLGRNIITTNRYPSLYSQASPFQVATLEMVTVGSSVTELRYNLFNATALNTVKLSENLATIGTSAFYDSNIEEIVIPSSVTTIGESAFAYCKNLKKIELSDCKISELEKQTFRYCSSLESIILPEGLTDINSRAFENCAALKSISFPSTTSFINSWVFDGCDSIIEITSLNSTPPYLGANFSTVVNKNATLYVPTGAVEAYDAASYWRSFQNIKEIGASVEDGELVADGIYYKILSEDDKTVAVTFRGETFDAYADEYTGDIVIPETVTIDGKTYTVTEIGRESFRFCPVTSVIIPNTVTVIGVGAFYGCESLNSVTIPDSVKRIDNYAFYHCDNLTQVSLPNAVEYIGGYAFFSVPGLTSVTLPNTLTSMGYGTFANCPNLYEIKVAEGLDWSSTDGVLFYDSGTVLIQYPAGKTDSSYTIPYNVTEIANYAFYNCDNLINIDTPEWASTIGNSAFCDCSNLEKITIPNRVNNIGYMALSYCASLKSITCKATTPPSLEEYVFSGTDMTIPLYVPVGSKSSYETAEGWKEFTNIIEMEEVNLCIGGIYYKILSEEDKTVAVTFRGETYETYADEYIGDIVIPETVTIDGKTYTVTEIGRESFCFCPVTSVVIPNTVTTIGMNAFYGCESLNSVTIPDSVKIINDYAFYHCDNLTQVSLPNAVEYIGGDAFYSVPGLTSVTLPNTLTSMGYGAFANCPNLYEIKVAEGLDWLSSIDGVLFYNNESVLIQYPAGKTDSSYTIPNTVTKIADYAFSRCYNLINIDTPEWVSTIGKYAFFACPNLEKITIPKGVYYIGHQALSYCESLKSITCKVTTPPSLEGQYVFSGTDMTIPLYVPIECKSRYETAEGWKEFTNIIEMEEVNPSIGGIYYKILSEEDKTVAVTFRGETYDAYADEYTGDIVIPETVTIDGKTYTVTEIGEYAFLRCPITSVIIPNSVKRIDDCAFYHCDNLTQVSLPNAVEYIGGDAFYSVPGLTSVTLPNTLTSMGYGAFANCPNLYEIKVAEGLDWLSSIDGVLFYNNESVLIQYPAGKTDSSYTIPNTVTEIAYESFDSCLNLTNIEISESVSTIGNYAFWYCSNLEQITISSSVKSIGYGALYSCNALKSITCKATTPPNLVSGVFYGVDKTIPLYVPIGCKSSYEAAEGWKEFTNIIEMGEVDLKNICINGIYYRILSEENLTAEVKYKGETYDEYENEYTGDIVIPETITVNGKTYTVTEIGYGAFRGCEITSIVIPNTVTTINYMAFEFCENLKSAVIPNSVTVISGSAFFSCDNLTDVSIPKSIKHLGQSAFSYCPAFTSLTLPNTLEYFGRGAFSCCPNLYEIKVAEGLDWLSSVNGVLFNNDQTELLQYPAGKVDSSYTIPNTVTLVSRSSFASCDNLLNVNIPESVTTIGEWSFDNCSKLQQITIPSTVTAIETCAFRHCFAVSTMTCKAKTPPVVQSSETFYGLDKSIPLYVPIGCKNDYETAEVWKEFTNIQEVDFSGIDNIGVDCNKDVVEYYNLNGIKVAEENLTTGFYIMKQGRKVTKIFVK